MAKIMPKVALLWYGDQCIQNTGGWKFPKTLSSKGNIFDSKEGCLSFHREMNKQNVSLMIEGASVKAGRMSVHTKEKVRFSGCTSIIIDVSIEKTGGFCSLYIRNDVPDNVNALTGNIASFLLINGINVIDIRGYNLSEHYISICVCQWDRNGNYAKITANINRVWME